MGRLLRKKIKPDKDTSDDLVIVQGATLTLLGLIIGFSFSMAISRYDQRKVFEEAEVNAIRTEFLRAELLPDTDGAKIHDLLRKYLDQRIAFYEAQDWAQLEQANRNVVRLQSELWSAVRAGTRDVPVPIAVLVISGLNEVMSSEGNTQAAWTDHIPLGAWALMVTVACFGSALIGITAHRVGVLMSLPLVFSVAFFLISDLDHPHGGLIHTHPQNLISLSHSLQVQ
jgi:hypothetical protein